MGVEGRCPFVNDMLVVFSSFGEGVRVVAERSAPPGAGHDPRAVPTAGGALAAQGVLRDGEQQRNVNISTVCVS